MSMVLPGPGLGPRRVPAFTWWARGRLTRGFGPEAMVATARTVLDRRKERLTAAAESALRRAYEETASERDAAIHASAGHEGGQG
jgi:hypothetical protein